VPGTRTSQTLVVAAHYDTTAESPGANASASGAAVLLALARELVGKRYSRGLRLVWLSNESGGGGPTGSAVYAARTQRERLPVVGTLTLGSLGNYSLEYGSQRYPEELLFGGEHRTTFGNFVAVLSNAGSNPLLERVRPVLSAASLPVEELVLPEDAPLAAEGPQARFWNAGLSGLVLTDTGQFRSPYPEGASDTLDKVDFDRLARVTRLLGTLVASLAEGESPATPDAVPPAASTPGDFMPELPPLIPPGSPTPPG
jgi:Zn-dependent M28 family amino/carboxypeptidase